MPKVGTRVKEVGLTFGEVWSFLRVRKKWWLAPILIMMIFFGLLMVLTSGSAIAPFIYTLF